ncbi:MAG TPA: hypothetical protein VF062_22790 [Candidatus Limnocylindrales bacterium]
MTTTLQEQRETFSRGRRLVRLSGWMLGVNAFVMLSGLATIPIGLRRAWLDNDDATPAVIGAIAIFIGMIAFFWFTFAGRRMIRRSVHDVVAAGPLHEVPGTLRIGPAGPWLQASGVGAFLGFACPGHPSTS